MSTTIREHAIKKGWIVPAVARPGDGRRDPTPAAWIEKPTLRLDHLGARAAREERQHWGAQS